MDKFKYLNFKNLRLFEQIILQPHIVPALFVLTSMNFILRLSYPLACRWSWIGDAIVLRAERSGWQFSQRSYYQAIVWAIDAPLNHQHSSCCVASLPRVWFSWKSGSTIFFRHRSANKCWILLVPRDFTIFLGSLNLGYLSVKKYFCEYYHHLMIWLWHFFPGTLSDTGMKHRAIRYVELK